MLMLCLVTVSRQSNFVLIVLMLILKLHSRTFTLRLTLVLISVKNNLTLLTKRKLKLISKPQKLFAGFDGTPTTYDNQIDYKYNEGQLLADLQKYIDATYGEQYSTNQFQATEFIIDG